MTPEEAQQQQQAMMPQSPGQGVIDQAKQAGGQELADATQAQLAADGGMNMMAGLGQNMPQQPVSITPEQQQMMQQMQAGVPAQ